MGTKNPDSGYEARDINGGQTVSGSLRKCVVAVRDADSYGDMPGVYDGERLVAWRYVYPNGNPVILPSGTASYEEKTIISSVSTIRKGE